MADKKETKQEQKEFSVDELKKFKEQIQAQKEKLIKIYDELVEKLNAFGPLIPLLDRQMQQVDAEIAAKDKNKKS